MPFIIRLDFTVIESVHSACGQRVDSYSIAEFETEGAANDFIELQFLNLRHIPDSAGDDYLRWHVDCA